MRRITSLTFAALVLTLTACASKPSSDDQALVGSWQGMREENGKCQFLSWTTIFEADHRFSITFYRDAARQQLIQTERGHWSSANGKRVLKTDGVKTPEVYEYKVIDPDTVRYVNTVKDPTADCQEDYAFTEHRMRN